MISLEKVARRVAGNPEKNSQKGNPYIHCNTPSICIYVMCSIHSSFVCDIYTHVVQGGGGPTRSREHLAALSER